MTPPHREGRSHSFADAEDAALEEAALIDHPLYKYTADVEAHLAKDKDGDGDEDDDKDKERKRAFIKKIVTAILRYHISPSKLYFNEIQDKQTIATSLNQTKDVGVPFRIRASPRLDLLPPPPKFDVSLNFYARIRNGPALLAKNGIIHFVSTISYIHLVKMKKKKYKSDSLSKTAFGPPSSTINTARPASGIPIAILRFDKRHTAD